MPLPSRTADLPRRLFSPIARGYDRPAQLLSLLQYRRWHRFLLSRLPLPARPEPARPEPCRRVEGRVPPAEAEPAEAVARHGDVNPPSSDIPPAPPTSNLQPPTSRLTVLDMASGTGALAFDLLQRPGLQVVAADITRPMLLQAQARPSPDGARPHLVECTAEAPPFADASFDAVIFAYLLRYVADVPATLRGLARLLRPGGAMASLDFAVPRGALYPLWRLHTDLVLPLAGALLSPAWRRVGAFLGPSIRDFYRRWPQERLLQAWREAGFPDVRARRLSLGGALVMWGTKACPERSRRAK